MPPYVMAVTVEGVTVLVQMGVLLKSAEPMLHAKANLLRKERKLLSFLSYCNLKFKIIFAALTMRQNVWQHAESLLLVTITLML